MADPTPAPPKPSTNNSLPAWVAAAAMLLVALYPQAKDIIPAVTPDPPAPVVIPPQPVVVPPAPVVVPPVPVINPEVVPIVPPTLIPSAKLELLDHTGKAFSQPVADGKLFIVSSKTSVGDNVSITVVRSNGVPEKDMDHVEIAGGVACTLRNGASATFFCTAVSAGKVDVASLFVTCNKAPQPPPQPTPPGPVDPTPAPPIKTGDLRVLMIYDSSQKLPPDLVNVLNSTELRKVLNQRCSKTDGLADWRCWSKTTKTESDVPVMASLWKATVDKATQNGLPAVVVAHGENVEIHNIQAPYSVNSILALLD